MILPNCRFSLGTATRDERNSEQGDIVNSLEEVLGYVENIVNAQLSRMPLSYKDGPARPTHFLYVDRNNFATMDTEQFPKNVFVQITHRLKGPFKQMTELADPEIYKIGLTAKHDLYENTVCLQLIPR